MIATEPRICVVCGVTYVRNPKIRAEQFNRSNVCSVVCRHEKLRKKFDIPKPKVIEFSGDTRLLAGKFIVDAEYFDWLNQYSWHLGSTGYGVFRGNIDGKKTVLRIHRLVIDAKDGEEVDHINRNKLDNRMSNLRIVTHQENMLNTDYVENAKYYSWKPKAKKWRVEKGRKVYGYFDTESAAKEVADKIKAANQ